MLPGSTSNVIYLPSDQVKTHTYDAFEKSETKPAIQFSSSGSSQVLVTPRPIPSATVSSSLRASETVTKNSSQRSNINNNNENETRKPIDSTATPSSSSVAIWNQNRRDDIPSRSSSYLYSNQTASATQPPLQSPALVQPHSRTAIPSSSASAPLSASPMLTTPPPSASSSSSLSSASWNSAPTVPWLVQEMEATSANVPAWPSGPRGREEMWVCGNGAGGGGSYPSRPPFGTALNMESARLDLPILDGQVNMILFS